MTFYIKSYGQTSSGTYIYAAWRQSDLSFVTWMIREEPFTDPLNPALAWLPDGVEPADPGDPPSP